jgi:hypothetical protein
MKKLMMLIAWSVLWTGILIAQTPAIAPAPQPSKAPKEAIQKPGQAGNKSAKDVRSTGAHPVKKDGTPDKRYKSNRHLKKDGTPDRRFKEHKDAKGPETRPAAVPAKK